VFEFFSDAHQLEQITPPWLHFHVLTPRPVAMFPGALIDYRLRLHWIPIRWRTEISEWNPPFQFVDRQLIGPYRLWQHLHTFEERDGGTLVRDHVDYSSPGGRLVHSLFVKPDLVRIFNYRRQKLIEILG
jgi:ligand-binding SRPBCC domain-containing protein